MIKVVTSDLPWLIVSLEGTVTTPVPDDRIEALAQSALLDPNEVHERLWASGFIARCCLGELSLADMIEGIRDRLEADLTHAHLMGLWCLAYDPNLDAIEELATSGRRIGVIADETPLFREAFDAYLPEVDLGANQVWISSEHAALTTNEQFFRAIVSDSEMGGLVPTLVTTSTAHKIAAAAAGWHVAPDLDTALH